MDLCQLMSVESQRPGKHGTQRVRELFKGRAVPWFSARSQWFVLQPSENGKSGQYTVSLNLAADPLPTATQADASQSWQTKRLQAEQKQQRHSRWDVVGAPSAAVVVPKAAAATPDSRTQPREPRQQPPSATVDINSVRIPQHVRQYLATSSAQAEVSQRTSRYLHAPCTHVPVDVGFHSLERRRLIIADECGCAVISAHWCVRHRAWLIPSPRPNAASRCQCCVASVRRGRET
jgi:hypothetical protein